MVEIHPYSFAPIIGYHGCSAAVGEAVLAGKESVQASKNDYDWLGHGIYFWVASPQRARDWAVRKVPKVRGNKGKSFVLGAFIAPGHCLNLTDFGVREQLVGAYESYAALMAVDGEELPKNGKIVDGIPMNRKLDCAVIEWLHELQELATLPAYDSVYGVFEEGGELYPGAGFKEKTHIQIAVRNPSCILGYFRVR